MFFAKTIISLLAVVAGQAFALPAKPTRSTSDGIIGKNTNSVGDYYITKLNAYNSTTNGSVINHISFNVHGADDARKPSFCSYEWPTNGSYYVETYTPCNGSYQFLISNGLFANITTFQLEVEHAGSTTVENGIDEPGSDDFAKANITMENVGCIDYAQGFKCKQVAGITAKTVYMVG